MPVSWRKPRRMPRRKSSAPVMLLRDDVAALAVKGAEQILKREVDARAHAELLNQLRAQL